MKRLSTAPAVPVSVPIRLKTNAGVLGSIVPSIQDVAGVRDRVVVVKRGYRKLAEPLGRNVAYPLIGISAPSITHVRESRG